MRAYMKSEMPFRGVQKPARRKLVNETLRTYPLEDKAVWQNTVLELWRNAEYREERYIALDIAGAPQYLDLPYARHPAYVRRDGGDRRLVGLRRRSCHPPPA